MLQRKQFREKLKTEQRQDLDAKHLVVVRKPGKEAGRAVDVIVLDFPRAGVSSDSTS
jgi:hypothetical protein